MTDTLDTKQMFRRWAETSTGMIEPFIRLNQLTLETMERLAELQIEAGREYVELQKQQLEHLGKTQDPSEFVSNQQKLATDFSDVLRHQLEKLQEIGGSTSQAWTNWLQDAAGKVAVQTGENLREATKSASKAAGGKAGD